MKGWILYKSTAAELKPDLYEIHRFIEVAAEKGIDLRVVKPDQFDLIVTRDDRKSILLDGEVVSLPDFLLPRPIARPSKRLPLVTLVFPVPSKSRSRRS